MTPYYSDMFAFIGVGVVAYKLAQLVLRVIEAWEFHRAYHAWRKDKLNDRKGT